MKFTKKQKKIVQDIMDKKVYDITSFLRVYGHTKEFKYDKEGIEAAFNEIEQGRKYKVLKQGLSQFNMKFSPTTGKVQHVKNTFTDDDFEYKKATIDYSKLVKHRTVNDTEFKFNLLQTNIIGTGFSDIFDFLVVWQHLKENGLILEVEKQMKNEDVSVFYNEVNKGDKIPNNCNVQSFENLPNLRGINNKTIENIIFEKEISNIFDSIKPPERDAMNFVSTTLEFDEESFKICESKISYKIIPTPQLYYFIQKNFKTDVEAFNRNTLIAAWTAIIITLTFSIISLGFNTISYNNSNEDTAKYFENIDILQDKLDDINNNIIEQQRLLTWEDHIKNIYKEQSKLNEIIRGINNE